jgi:small-conductance mechanosensitive channel
VTAPSNPFLAQPAPAPTPAPTATTTKVPEELGRADALKDAVTQQSDVIGGVIGWLDAFGFTIGATRISAWGVLVVFVVIVGLYLFARIGSRIGHRLFKRLTGLDAGRRLLGEKLLSIAIWAFAIMIGVDILGIDLTALTVFSGAFGLAVGFGLQKTFGNLLAGIIMLMDRSIKPGDVIAVNDGITNTVGQVKKIGLRAVSVTTRDKKEYLIPNENLMINQVENWSYSSREVRIKVPVSVAYGSDIEVAERLMLDAAKQTRRVLDRPAPTAWLHAFGRDSIEFEAQLWIRDPEEGIGNVRSDYLKVLWRLFRDNGVQVPFPQRDLNLRDTPELRALIAALAREPAPQAETEKPA